MLVLLRAVAGVRLEVSGRENLPRGPALIASRHESAFDTLVWFALGYSLAFGAGSRWIGNFDRAWFAGLDYLQEAKQVAVSHVAPHLPESRHGAGHRQSVS